MEKELLEYIHGERNAVRAELVLSREKTKTRKAEYVCVSIPGTEQSIPLYIGWAKKLPRNIDSLVTITTTDTEVKSGRHTTGGKRPYIMLMQDKIHIVKDLSVEASGLLLKLFCSGYVEWGTGRVIQKRPIKAMTIKKMSDKFGIPIFKIKTLIKELRENGVISYDKTKRAYFIDREFAKKGGRSK